MELSGKKISFVNIFKYVLLGFTSIVCIILLYKILRVPINDIDNARYLLSSIMQSLAAILAIVISLTLVAVQLFSQNYSTRILKKFINMGNSLFWGLILLYSISIIYVSIILGFVSLDPKSSFNMYYINFSIILTIFCLIFLFPYINVTIKNLEPEKVINDISNEINANFISKLTEFDKKRISNDDFTDPNRLPPDDDILIPLIDIIIGSIKNGHTDTAETGLTEIGNSFKYLIENDIITDNDKDTNKRNYQFVFKYLLDHHIERVKRIAIINGDYKSISLIIKIIDKLGISISDKNPDSYQISLNFLGDLAEKIVKIEFKSEIITLVVLFEKLINNFNNKSINNVGFSEIHPWRDLSIETMRYLNVLWKKSLEKREIGVDVNIEFYLKRVIINLSMNGLTDQIMQETYFLMKFGIDQLDNDPKLIDRIIWLIYLPFNHLFGFVIYHHNTKGIESNKAIINIIESLKFIGLESINKGIYDLQVGDYYQEEEPIRLQYSIIYKIITALESIATAYLTEYTIESSNQEEDIVIRVLNYINGITVQLISKKSHSASEGIKSIYKLGKESIKNPSMNKTSLLIVDYLKQLSSMLIEIESDDISDCLKYLKELGILANLQKTPGIQMWVIEHLGELGILMTSNIRLKGQLNNLIDYLGEIILYNINTHKTNKKVSIENIVRSITKIKQITDEMFKQNFEKKDLNNVSKSINNIIKELELNDMDDLPEINILKDLNAKIKDFDNI